MKHSLKITASLLFLTVLVFISCDGDVFLGKNDKDKKTVIPLTPGPLEALAISSNDINLTWLDNSDNENGFIIERSIDGTDFSEITTSIANSTSYSNTELTESAMYYYRIKAFNVTGDSSYSNIVSTQTFCELLAHWKLDGNFSDETGNNHATVIGNFSYSAGKDGTCPTFDWTNYGVVSSPSGMDKDVYTIAAWVKRYNYNTAPYIRLSNIAHFITGSTGLWQLIGEGGIANVHSGYKLPLFEWHHFTVVLDRINNEVNFYRDGNNIGTQTISSWGTDPTEIQIGTFNGDNRWNGCIDDIRIYGGRLSDSQIQNLYNSYPASVPDPAPAAPTGLSANPVNYSSIQIKWTDNANNEHGYRIEQSTDGGNNYSVIGTTVQNIDSYTDNGLTANTTYHYRVQAFNDSDSAYSPVISETTAIDATLPELISHWRIENNLSDETGNNHANTIGSFSYTTGMDGSCATFAGSNYGIVSSPYGLDRDIYTVMAWVRRSSHATAPYIRLTGIGHFITSGTIADTSSEWVFVEENGASYTASGYSINSDEWHHFTTIINRSQGIIKFYLDGVIYGTNIITPWVTNGTEIQIGRYSDGCLWNGNIDELRIYGGELSDSEITTIFNTY